MFCAQCGQWMAEGQAACERCGAVRGAAVSPDFPSAPLGVAAAPPLRPTALPDVQYAGFWRRVCVVVIDALVLFFPTSILRVAFGGNLWNSSFDDPSAVGWLVFDLVVTWLYCAFLESSPAQGTLGQQVMGLRVCDLELRRISFLRACARHFAQWLSVLTCGVGYLVNLVTRKRQTLHDLVAGCVHVRAESLEARARVVAT